jgi:hypothetical protein
MLKKWAVSSLMLGVVIVSAARGCQMSMLCRDATEAWRLSSEKRKPHKVCTSKVES